MTLAVPRAASLDRRVGSTASTGVVGGLMVKETGICFTGLVALAAVMVMVAFSTPGRSPVGSALTCISAGIAPFFSVNLSHGLSASTENDKPAIEDERRSCWL